jgi:hypothetical protein
VLYYRREQSASAVASAMETTEELVRQRLARGRAMLREQVARTVEQNLVRSAPSEALALAIMAGLPPLASQAATVGLAAKGTSTLAANFFPWFSVLFGPLIAFGCGIGGLRRAIQSASTTGQKWFIVGYGAVTMLFIGVLFYGYTFSPSFLTHHDRHGYRQMGFMLGVTAVGTVVILLGRRRLTRMVAATTVQGSCDSVGRQVSLGLIAAIVISSVLWMFRLAWITRDWEALGLLSGLTGALIAACAYGWRSPNFLVRRVFTILFVPILGAMTLLMVHWRMPYWNSVIFHPGKVYPMSWVSLNLMAVFFICIAVFVGALLGERMKRH